jgi:hypothetical protein
LESTYREQIVKDFTSLFLHAEGAKYVAMLAKWCPEKIHPLLNDSLVYLPESAQKAIEKRQAIAKRRSRLMSMRE